MRWAKVANLMKNEPFIELQILGEILYELLSPEQLYKTVIDFRKIVFSSGGRSFVIYEVDDELSPSILLNTYRSFRKRKDKRKVGLKGKLSVEIPSGETRKTRFILEIPTDFRVVSSLKRNFVKRDAPPNSFPPHSTYIVDKDGNIYEMKGDYTRNLLNDPNFTVRIYP